MPFFLFKVWFWCLTKKTAPNILGAFFCPQLVDEGKTVFKKKL